MFVCTAAEAVVEKPEMLAVSILASTINLTIVSYLVQCGMEVLTLSYPGMERAVVETGPSNLRPGSKELYKLKDKLIQIHVR